jgi:hypothetical protein
MLKTSTALKSLSALFAVALLASLPSCCTSHRTAAQTYQPYAPKMPATRSILVFDLTRDLASQTWEAKEAYMISTVIQGIVNRTSAEKIYFTHSPQEHDWKPAPTDQFMLDDGIVPLPRTTPALDGTKKYPVLSYLLTHYQSFLKGKVWCQDFEMPNWDKDSAIMAAITACGIEDAIPVTSGTDAYVRSEGLQLPVKADTRNLKTKSEAYQWAKANYFQAATSRKIVGFHSYTAFPEQNYIADQFPIVYDYLIANRAFVICSDDAQVLDDLMNSNNYPSGAFVLGLPTNEGMMVMMEDRGYPFEICNLPNLTVMSSFPTDFNYKPTAPVAEPTIDPEGAYVAFFVTDGDSLGFSGSFHYDKIRNSPAKGAYPMTWSTSILLNDLMPTYIKWRSENTCGDKYEIVADSFHVSVPSEYGYAPFLKFHQDVFANAKGLYKGALNLFYTTPRYTHFVNDVQPDLFLAGYCGARNGNTVAWSYTGSRPVLTTRLSGGTQSQADSGGLLERAARTAIDSQPAGQPAFAIVTAGDARHSGDSVACVKAAAEALNANPGKRHWHILRVTDLTATYKKYIEQSGGVSLNQAYLKKATASSTDNPDNLAKNAVDGRANGGTRWSSQSSDPQWLCVDLGAVKPVNRVVLDWEKAYGKAFQIQVSIDAATWTDVYSTTSGKGGVDNISFAPTDARYVRVYGTKRGTDFGYSLWEFEVYAAR